MNNVVKIEKKKMIKPKKKVCAYARVSSGKDTMLHSLSAQVSYYSKLIQSHKDWQYVGVYADEAFSGTKVERPNFQRLMTDAKDGKIDMIITKSISRFARNTVTLLEATRELKQLNIDVYFEEQNIHSLSSEGEVMLSLLASFAQEEARSMSENMKWRIRHNFQNGQIWGSKHCFGYVTIDKKLSIVPEEAEIVKRIFDLYVNGLGIRSIVKLLNKEGVGFKDGSEWKYSTLRDLISNVTYTGDLLLQTSYTPDFLTKKKARNRGELQQYYVEDNHEPIITKEQFNLTQKLKEERTIKASIIVRPNSYPFSGIIKCGICGCVYRHKKTKYRTYWICSNFDTNKKEACNSKQIPEPCLFKETCEVLKVESLENITIKDFIKEVIVKPGNVLEFHLKKGEIVTRVYKDLNRSDGWTPEMRRKVGEKNRERRMQNGRSNGNTAKD